MQPTGLEAVTNAAALFAPSAAADDLQPSSDDSSSSSRLVGTAIAVIQDGLRPLPIDIQALAYSRLREVPADAAVTVPLGSYAGGEDDSSSTTEEDNDSWKSEGKSEGGNEAEEEEEAEEPSSSSIAGVGFMRGADR